MASIQFKGGTIQFKGGTIQFKGGPILYYTDGTENVPWNPQIETEYIVQQNFAVEEESSCSLSGGGDEGAGESS